MHKYKILLILTIIFACINCGGSEENGDPVFYLFVDELPKFGNSDNDLYKYIYNNLKWPKLFDGTDQILASFVVNQKGEIENIKIEKFLSQECADEVVNVLMNMPLWTPAKKNGEAVSVKIYLPIVFALK